MHWRERFDKLDTVASDQSRSSATILLMLLQSSLWIRLALEDKERHYNIEIKHLSEMYGESTVLYLAPSLFLTLFAYLSHLHILEHQTKFNIRQR